MTKETKFNTGDKVVYKRDPLKSPREVVGITFVYYNNGSKDISYLLNMIPPLAVLPEDWIREEDLERYWEILN